MNHKFLYLLAIAISALCAAGCKYSFSDKQLDAFKQKADSMQAVTKHLQKKIDHTLSAYEANVLKKDPEHGRFAYERAQQIKQCSDNLEKVIDKLKDTLIAEGGGIVESRGDVKARSNIYLSRHLMVDQGRAADLKTRIIETRSKVLSLLDLKQSEQLKTALLTDDPEDKSGLNKTWESEHFGLGIPLASAITDLTAIQLETKNMEASAIKIMLTH